MARKMGVRLIACARIVCVAVGGIVPVVPVGCEKFCSGWVPSEPFY
jgi:hypothetical protein